MSRTGSSIAWHKNVTFSIWFLTSLLIEASTLGIPYLHALLQIHVIVFCTISISNFSL